MKRKLLKNYSEGTRIFCIGKKILLRRGRLWNTNNAKAELTPKKQRLVCRCQPKKRHLEQHILRTFYSGHCSLGCGSVTLPVILLWPLFIRLWECHSSSHFTLWPLFIRLWECHSSSHFWEQWAGFLVILNNGKRWT